MIVHGQRASAPAPRSGFSARNNLFLCCPRSKYSAARIGGFSAARTPEATHILEAKSGPNSIISRRNAQVLGLRDAVGLEACDTRGGASDSRSAREEYTRVGSRD